MKHSSISLAFLSAFLTSTASAEQFSIATWNAAGATVENAFSNIDGIKELGAAYRKQIGELPDVLVLQEVTSFAASRFIAQQLGYQNATIVTSNFSNDEEKWPLALEISVVSKQDIMGVRFLQRPYKQDLVLKSGFLQTLSSDSVKTIKTTRIEEPKDTDGIEAGNISRGIVEVDLDSETTIYGVHLKSSGMEVCRAWQISGETYRLQSLLEDYGLDNEVKQLQSIREAATEFQKENLKVSGVATTNEAVESAKNRERAATIVAKMASAKLEGGGSVYVAGDFNTPAFEKCKTGSNLEQDHVPTLGCSGKNRIVKDNCGSTDGFDDTFHILKSAFAEFGFSFLTETMESSYVKKGFANSPIDNILVAGPISKGEFRIMKIDGKKDAKKKLFGSDHYSIAATMEK